MITRWRDRLGDVWNLGPDGYLYMDESNYDGAWFVPPKLLESVVYLWGPLEPLDDNDEPGIIPP